MLCEKFIRKFVFNLTEVEPKFFSALTILFANANFIYYLMCSVEFD